MSIIKNILFFLNLLIFINNSFAEHKQNVPRFASIKSNEVNARTGPSSRYPIEWTFVKKGEPVEVFAEFEQWRRIRDKYGEGGWIHSSMLSSKRYVIIKGEQPQCLYKKNNIISKIIAKLTPELRCEVIKCQDKFCNIKCNDISGWITRSSVWGVYNEEKW